MTDDKGLSLFPLAMLTSLPYIVPFAGWLYGGVVFVNPLIPWWIKAALLGWSCITIGGVGRSQMEIVKAGNENGFNNNVHAAQIYLNLIQYPMFIAFLWSFTLKP